MQYPLHFVIAKTELCWLSSWSQLRAHSAPAQSPPPSHAKGTLWPSFALHEAAEQKSHAGPPHCKSQGWFQGNVTKEADQQKPISSWVLWEQKGESNPRTAAHPG